MSFLDDYADGHFRDASVEDLTGALRRMASEAAPQPTPDQIIESAEKFWRAHRPGRFPEPRGDS